MELQYVQPGEKITAQSYNTLVDACRGSGNSSSEGFMNTGSGTVFWPRRHLNAKYYNGAWRTMFQVVPAEYWVQTTRGQWDPPNTQRTLLIDLGPDAESCKSNIAVMGKGIEKGAVIVGESPSMDAEITDDLYKNASDENTSWVDLGIKEEDTDFIAGDVYEHKTEEDDESGGEKKKVTKYYFAVTDKSEDDVIDRAKQIFGIDDGEFTLIKRFILSKIGSVGYKDVTTPVQAHTGAISWSRPNTAGEISVDSEIESLYLSSLTTVSCETQVSGLSGELSSVSTEAYTFWNFDKAERISLGEALGFEKPEKDQAPSCRVDLIVRVGKATNDLSSAPTAVNYLELSSVVVSCDTNFYSKDPEEMNSTSLQWTSAEKGQPALQIKGFADEESIDPPEKYDLLVRETNDDDEKILKYVNPTDMVLVDNDISSLHRNSLEKKTDPEDADKKFVQLYKFDDGSIDVNLGLDAENPEIPDDYQILVRETKDGKKVLKYASLSVNLSVESGGAISTDTEHSDTSHSIEQQDNGVVKINGWDTKTNKTVSEVSAHTDGYDVLMRHSSGGVYETEYINIAPLLSGGGTSEKRKIRKNWDWPTDADGNYIAPGVPNATMYGYFQYGYGLQYFSGTIPSQPPGKTLLCLSGDYSKTSTGSPSNLRFVWTNSSPYANLSSFGVPLYARNNSPDNGPTFDYNAGYFVIPTYY